MSDKRKVPSHSKSKPKLPRGKPGAVATPRTSRQPTTDKFAAEDMGVAAKE